MNGRVDWARLAAGASLILFWAAFCAAVIWLAAGRWPPPDTRKVREALRREGRDHL